MACVTLKRTLPLETLINGSSSVNNSNILDASSVNINTSGSTLVHRNGGGGGGGPLAKRRRCTPLTYVPAPRSTSSASACATAPLATAAAAVPQLSGDALRARLRDEIRRLRRARLLMNNSAVSGDGTEEEAHISIDSSLSTACQCINNTASSMSLSPPPSASNVPLFNLQQISLICARLLSERDQELRCEYERVLSEKLAEQYEAFLRFSHEQLYRNHCDNPMSYVS